MAWKWYDSEVVKIEEVNSILKRFYLEIIDFENFEFEAGQFITIDLPISEKRIKRWRSYSIANAPDGTNLIELCVVLLEKGLGTNYLFHDVEIGTKIKFKGPSGTFYLPKEIQTDIVMICTGTGVAPFRSMINDLLKNKKTKHNIHLIFGARYKEDILYYEEFQQLEKVHQNFKYDVCLSRENHWNGYKGYVHQVYMDDYNEGAKNIKFYICGWSQMIDEVVANLLLKKKIDKNNIIYELYG